ncbi:MAG: glycosyltransferase family 39 protein [Cyanobacteriota bacterium]|nr:glycosyltransferase family 39 protein [Cyanobacteriota bacterium]
MSPGLKQLRCLRFLQSHWLVLACLGLGLALFVWGLGSTGQVDETPPLFAASARAMAESGDWLTPRVNGLPRYDKPPLVYWLMGLGYLLPAQQLWNPLGTWASGLPSAIACMAVMLSLALTVQRHWGSRLLGLSAALAFALSPLNLLWGRMAVSDALFSGLLSISLLLFWRTQAQRRGGVHWRGWWHGWLLLGLAVLAKGPVAVVLAGLTLLSFALSQGELALQLRGLRAGRGLALTAAVALPWYAAALLVEGKPYWDSFFGYHNMQRFTTVVNDHLQPWWFFGLILVVASLPASPLLLLGLWRSLRQSTPRPEQSLSRFAACWLLVVLAFFTLAATKLPSYWIPATPGAALLIVEAAAEPTSPRWSRRLAWGLTLLLAGLIAMVLALSPLWFGQVTDPEMPGLASAVLASGHLQRAGLLWGLAALAPLLLWLKCTDGAQRLLALQLPLVGFALLALQPLWSLGDQLRSAPVRTMASAVSRIRQPQEALAMVGILKPSLHYYSRRVVLYEGKEPADLSNLADRLSRERRRGQRPSSSAEQPTVLLVIDAGTAALPHWQGLEPQRLASAGIYRLWRLDRRRLEARARALAGQGIKPTWQLPRPERY